MASCNKTLHAIGEINSRLDGKNSLSGGKCHFHQEIAAALLVIIGTNDAGATAVLEICANRLKNVTKGAKSNAHVRTQPVAFDL